ncbi:MAG: 30S ribosomal protein S9 [Legionellales bacterium]|nr:30S ribosomal protein S9 [Legionellales bacterium]HAV94081.1 30S ribosomal protein S9 [Pseudomonadota bacterium]
MTAQIVNGYYHAIGRRKASAARVFMKEGTGKITINNRSIDEFFGKKTIWNAKALAPLSLIKQDDMFDLTVTVKGGGINGQAGAISLGLARALDLYAKKNSPEIIVEEKIITESESEGEGSDSVEIEEKVDVLPEGPLGVERWHKAIRQAGYLTRDSRRVLRKKVGLVKARKAKQFSKR